jgi:hypothetical protein
MDLYLSIYFETPGTGHCDIQLVNPYLMGGSTRLSVPTEVCARLIEARADVSAVDAAGLTALGHLRKALREAGGRLKMGSSHGVEPQVLWISVDYHDLFHIKLQFGCPSCFWHRPELLISQGGWSNHVSRSSDKANKNEVGLDGSDYLTKNRVRWV